jgi:hypothetical protein
MRMFFDHRLLAAVLSPAGFGTVDGVLEARLATVESELESEVAQEVREDYAEIAPAPTAAATTPKPSGAPD